MARCAVEHRAVVQQSMARVKDGHRLPAHGKFFGILFINGMGLIMAGA
jgi:hypothetical protein